MRLRQVLSNARQEWQAFRQSAKVSGGRDALMARVRHNLTLEGVDANRLAALEQRVGALEGQGPQMASLQARAQEAAAQIDLAHLHLQASEHQMVAHLRDVEGLVHDLEQSTRRQLAGVDRRDTLAALAARIAAVTTWVEAATLKDTPRISVVLATRNRCSVLGRAIDSVRGQVYGQWELIVVDDGSTDATADLLTTLEAEDDRIVVRHQPHGGVGAARNTALASASGEIVCYLDDDNLMQPLWLKAVAWAFDRQPECEVLYGARIKDVELADHGASRELPFLQFEPFDRDRLEFGNFIDLGVCAHRRGLAEASFDESLRALGDWDLMLRLSGGRTPLALPVVASIYTTDEAARLGQSGQFAVSEAAVRARLLARQPLRVLAYNSLYPLVTETYIGDEMKALTDNGAILAWCTQRLMTSPVRVNEPLYEDLKTAVREFEPDLLFVYWAGFAAERLEDLARIGLPFALRVHSFDFDPAVIRRVQGHPLCLGVWAYPHHAAGLDGAHDLVPLLTTWDQFPVSAEERTLVLSMSAGLAKKDWPTLIGSFAELDTKGIDSRVVIGITADREDEPERVRQMIRESGASVMLSIDVPNDEVVALLSRTAVVVYTHEDGGPFGMPRSIIEGMAAGCSVVLPDRRSPGWWPVRSAGSIRRRTTSSIMLSRCWPVALRSKLNVSGIDRSRIPAMATPRWPPPLPTNWHGRWSGGGWVERPGRAHGGSVAEARSRARLVRSLLS